jgi:crotonobetainyl-CoA:carnitine CoA-transferase CaiB-like acyl-CoA transferase
VTAPPLVGVPVLDLTTWRPGPYATQLLVELGADVVKVEPPGGDPMRAFPELFDVLNAGKRSVVLDLKADGGRAEVLRLAARSEVVVESFRPGVAARLGLGWPDVERVNPEAIYCSVSGYGQDGPLAAVPGHDLNYQAWAGALSPDGAPPVAGRLPIGDLAGGLAAAHAIVAAYAGRLRGTPVTGPLDVAVMDVLATWTGAVAPRLAGGSTAEAEQFPGYGMFEAADGGIVTLGIVAEDHFWAALCTVLGLDDLGGLDFAARVDRGHELRAAVAAAIARFARDDIVDRLLASGVPVAPVLTREEMLALPHLVERGTVRAGPDGHPAMGRLVRVADDV